MSLTTIDQIRDEGNLPSDLPVGKLTPHLEGAESRLRSFLGDELYETVQAEAATVTRRKELSRAEAMVALYFALPIINIKAGPKGGIVRGTGFGETRSDFLSVSDVQKLADNFLEKATEIITRYNPDYDEADSATDVTILEGVADFIAV